MTTTFKDWTELGNIKGFYQALADSLNFCTQKYKAAIIGYVFMPSHIHLLLAINGKYLSGFMRDFKKYVAQKIAKDLKIQNKQIWNPRFDRVVIYSENILRTKLEYIHNNPVKGKLVANPEDWKWSSAVDYFTDRKGVINIRKDSI
ncbi:MAG: hypothetical protein GY841_06485 [FCB group bacterium]|nr:hypothetical protein [FCB group bacterium]